MKRSILIQSRLSSSRFPEKMMNVLGNIPLVEFVYKRCSNSKKADTIAVITSTDKSDDKLYEYCISHNIEVFRGSLNNVLERYIRSAEFYESDVICRVCGDSPFVDIYLVDEMFDIITNESLDYVSPDKRTCIAGLDSEIVTLNALKKTFINSNVNDELEHVTIYIKNNVQIFKVKFLDVNLKPKHLNQLSLTVDEEKDLNLGNKILHLMENGFNFSSYQLLEIIESNKKFLLQDPQ